MSAIRDAIRKVRFEQGQQSLASPFQTTTPQTIERGGISSLIRRSIQKVRNVFKPTEKVRVRDVVREIPKTIKKVTEFVFPPRRKLLAEIEEERGQTLLPEEAKRLIAERERDLLILRPPSIGLSFEQYLDQPALEVPFLGRIKDITRISKTISRKVLKVLTKQDLIDITRGKIIAGEKFELYK